MQMKQSYRILVLCAAWLLAADCCFALEDDFPKPKGDGPAVLVLAGGRPWVGDGFASMLVKSGCCVTGLNSVWLNGLGGASIKHFLTDLEEPVAKDGITSAFGDLSRYKLVVITGIPQEKLELLYTAEIAAVQRIGELNPRITRARENVGLPFVRETSFGTSWISEKGGALFFNDRISHMKLDLPENWLIEGHVGTELHNIPAETVLHLIKK